MKKININKKPSKAKEPMSQEYFISKNREKATKHIENCNKTDAEKIIAGTHKWHREGKTIRLIKL